VKEFYSAGKALEGTISAEHRDWSRKERDVFENRTYEEN
jgi:hypothetical protein